jgi:hypothetical protein
MGSRPVWQSFAADFLRQSRAEVIQTILAGVHATARIAQQKFRWVSTCEVSGLNG